MSDGIVTESVAFLAGFSTLAQLRAWTHDHAAALAHDRNPQRRSIYGHLACLLAEYRDGYRDDDDVRDALEAVLRNLEVL